MRKVRRLYKARACICRFHAREYTPPSSSLVKVSLTKRVGKRAIHRVTPRLPDGGDLIDRELGYHFVSVRSHDEHLLDPHPPVEHLTMLRLQSEHLTFPDRVGVLRRVYSGHQREVVVRQPLPVAPQVRGGFLLLPVSPSFLRRRELFSDVLCCDPRLDNVYRVVKPIEREFVIVLLLGRGLLPYPVCSVVAGVIPVPSYHDVDEDEISVYDHPVGKVPVVRPRVWTGTNYDRLDEIDPAVRVRIVEEMSHDLVLGDSGPQDLRGLVVDRIRDPRRVLLGLYLVPVLHRSRFVNRA